MAMSSFVAEFSVFDLGELMSLIPNFEEFEENGVLHPTALFTDTSVDKEPRTCAEARRRSDAALWEQSFKSELESLKQHNVYRVVEKPPGQKVIGSRWVCKVKRKLDGSIDKYKSRLVVKGYSQWEGIDYYSTFSPVVRHDTLRMFFAFCASRGMIMTQFDVKTAYLHGDLDEEIYIQQPEGFEDGTRRVWRLIKSLYGLKQAGLCWFKKLRGELLKFGFEQTYVDPCLFTCTRKRPDGEVDFIGLSVYVDDGETACTSQEISDMFLNVLQQVFEITIGDGSEYLGIGLHRREDGSFMMEQSSYALSIVKSLGFADCTERATPMAVDWTCEDSPLIEPGRVPYREAVGKLMYLANVTRPDISHAVGIASRALDRPTVEHWELIKRICRYLKKTHGLGLLYRTDGDDSLKLYSDADYGADRETRRSTSGIVGIYRGAAVLWKSKRQPTVSLSTTEAEYVAGALACCEGLWAYQLLMTLGSDTEIPLIFIDNTSAIRLAKNPELNQRTKHIDIKHHFLREKVQAGQVRVEYLSTEDQPADLLTKPLPIARFERLRGLFGLTPYTE